LQPAFRTDPEIAFRAAHEADPGAELYYNDYSLSNPAKRDAVCRLVRRLKSKGVRIDAVGMQSHNGLDYPDLSAYEASIDSFAACGVKVMVTELDLNVLPSPKGFSGARIEQDFEYHKRLNPYPEALPDSIYRKFEQRYLELFSIYRRHRHQMSRITLWGISDRDSWLNDFPVHGRTNYPLFFDRNYAEKPVVSKIIELWEGRD
jgi:endo-1,4-beta-xylanase